MFDRTRPRRSTLRMAFAFAAAGACLPLCAQPLAWSGRVGLASHWVVRGQPLSDDDTPVAFAGVDAYLGTGWSFGLAAMRLRARDGASSDGWSLHAGHQIALDDRWRWLVDLQHTGYAGSAALAAWRGPRATLGLVDGDRWSLTWNAEQPHDPALATRSVDLNVRWPLLQQLSAGGGIGRVVGGGGPHHNYGQAGLAWRAGDWQVQLDRTWGPPQAPPGYGRPPEPRARWVLGAQCLF